MSQMIDLPSGYDLLADGASESYDDSGSDVSWRFGVPSAIYNRFVQVVAGLPQTISYGGTSATRVVPLKNPSRYNCYASSIRSAPAPGAVPSIDGGMGIVHDYYYVDVQFTTPQYSYDGSEPMVSVQRGVSSEMVTFPGTAYQYPSDGKLISHDVGVPVQMVDYVLTFHRLPSLNNTLYDSLVGCVNSTTFRGSDPGTYLYRGCQSAGMLTMGGQASYEASQQFSYRSVPWNKVMRPDGGGFEAPVRLGTSDGYLIPSADLNQLYG